MREIIRLKNLDKIVCDRVVGFNSIKNTSSKYINNIRREMVNMKYR